MRHLGSVLFVIIMVGTTSSWEGKIGTITIIDRQNAIHSAKLQNDDSLNRLYKQWTSVKLLERNTAAVNTSFKLSQDSLTQLQIYQYPNYILSILDETNDQLIIVPTEETALLEFINFLQTQGAIKRNVKTELSNIRTVLTAQLVPLPPPAEPPSPAGTIGSRLAAESDGAESDGTEVSTWLPAP